MPIWRKLALGILSLIFIILLLATALDIGFVRTVTQPATVKKIVADSGIYNSVVPDVLAQTKSISTTLGDIPTSNPDVQRAAQAAIPPQYIQQNTEMAIDNVYDWLNGKIAQPNFSIDLSGAKTLFANNIADAVQKRLSALPPCSAVQSRQIVLNGNFDAYNSVCLPSVINPAAVAEQVKDQIVSSQDFLNNTRFNAGNVKNGGSNQSVFQQTGVKDIPRQYQLAKKVPWILGILTILTGAGIVFLSASRSNGLRHIGVTLLVIGLLILLFSWALNRTMNKDIAPKLKVDNAIFQQDIRNMVTDLTQRVDKNYQFFGGLYIGLGIVGIGAGEIIRRRPPLHSSASTPRAVGLG